MGKYCHIQFFDAPDDFGIAGSDGGESWDWSIKTIKKGHIILVVEHIVRYRVRKDKGMQVLREILREVEKEKKEPAHV